MASAAPSPSAAGDASPTSSSSDSSSATVPPPASRFGTGLIATLKPVVASCDEAIRSVQASQLALAQQLDSLNAGLDAVDHEAARLDLTPHLRKMQTSKVKINAIQTKLKTVNARVESIRQLAGQADRLYSTSTAGSSGAATAAAGVAPAGAGGKASAVPSASTGHVDPDDPSHIQPSATKVSDLLNWG